MPGYTGALKATQYNGEGQYEFSDGSVYNGSFRAGHMHGIGKLRFPDGATYAATWEDGLEGALLVALHPSPFDLPYSPL